MNLAELFKSFPGRHAIHNGMNIFENDLIFYQELLGASLPLPIAFWLIGNTP